MQKIDIVAEAREFSRRNTSQPMAGELLDQAANEIERLRSELDLLGPVTVPIKPLNAKTPRVKQAQAQARADAVVHAMANWTVHNIKPDGTVVFMISRTKTYMLIEFAPEHFAVIEALNK